ncbi:MAG: Histone deacetylase domain protein [Methanosaeta sp. PtaU1.Bin028]|nr:MAG: Histone deacetylase domain protein [Methanosaeta sp. PtaU1.Bin028]
MAYQRERDDDGMTKVAVVYHHDFPRYGYSILKDRIKPGYDSLMESGLADGEDVRVFQPEAAPLSLVEEVHTAHHMQNMSSEPYRDVALLSAGSVMLAADLVVSGQAQSAFAFTGTAGHHASRGGCWGFCYFNDVAITIRHLRKMGLKRFLIIDVDPHFGDGTRDFFGEDADVFHINFHAGSGKEFDRSRNNYDFGIGWAASDVTFLDEFSSALELARDFDYQICFLIFGHDSHQDDYGGFDLTLSAYPRMAALLKEAVGKKPLVVVLSGGSNPDVARRAIPDVVAVMAGKWPI